MGGDYLLDTNVVIAFFSAEREVVERMLAADSVVVPSIVLGELYFGARKSDRVAENLAKVERFLSQVAIAPSDERTAALFGAIKQQLRVAGHPLPDHDVWVAATSLQLGVALVSRDQHFAAIENLAWQMW